MNTILQYLFQMPLPDKFRVFVELLIIGIVVYWALSFLEGTRGERLFRGVIFIIVAGSIILQIVVKGLELERLAYLYQNIAIIAFLIVAIAFQPEIRRALIRIGQAGFLSSSPQQLSRSVEEIVSAITQLAATRTGAIMVIEQQVGLGEFIDTGVN